VVVNVTMTLSVFGVEFDLAAEQSSIVRLTQSRYYQLSVTLLFSYFSTGIGLLHTLKRNLCSKYLQCGFAV